MTTTDEPSTPTARIAPARPTDRAAKAWAARAASRWAQLLEQDDRAALATEMEKAAREAGVENIRFFTQKNLYARRILDRMGLRALERDMEAMRQTGTPEGLGRAQFLEGRVEQLRDAVRDFVERNLLLYARGETEKFREELLKSARLSNLERRDLDRMRVLVRQMAKKLAARYAKTRRRRLRGQLDTRRTLRRNMGWGGIPFITVWKQKRIEKPRVMVLCDVSGSVAAMSQFLLMFLYALNEALSDIRSFAFAGSLIEVSEILEKEPVEQAITKIMSTIGYGSSNYGNSASPTSRMAGCSSSTTRRRSSSWATGAATAPIRAPT